MTEAVTHYGESIKAIMNEEVGDGIMSAIDMYATVRNDMYRNVVSVDYRRDVCPIRRAYCLEYS